MDAIIVGSGFGGSVCAARLAEKGMRVLVLERGPYWGPLQRSQRKQDRRELPRGLWGSRKFVRNVRVARRGRRRERTVYADGLLESHQFDHLSVLTASGVGGGSHIYTGILDEPPPEFFDFFPDEITVAEMRPYFQRVREVLRPAPVSQVPEKNRVFEEALAQAGLPRAEYPDLAYVWGQTPDQPHKVVNAAGVEQSTSTWQCDAFVGCEDGSKTSLNLTYVPLALARGAELRPLCEVLAIGRDSIGYSVRYRDHRTGRNHTESAPHLVLAAGGLNTQRLLFLARDADRTLPGLPATLGRRFSPNGDLALLLWKTGVLHDSSRGPAIGATSRIIERGAYRYLIGEIGLPAQSLPVPRFLRRWLRRSTFLFCMGRDAIQATVEFDGTGLTTSAGRRMDARLYDDMEGVLRRLSGHYRPKAITRGLMPAGPDGLFTVHPLGGCSIGSSPNDGFVDHRGQVFGHPGLYVADGSLYPRSPGVAPSLTIAALAEREAALMG